MIFFEKSGIPLYRRGRSPRFRSKSEMYTYYSTKMLCGKFQRSRATRMWPFDDLTSFFFCAFSCIRNSVGDPLSFGPSRTYTCLIMCTFERCEKIVKIWTTRGSARNLNFYGKIWIFGSGSYIGGDRQFSTQEEFASETLDLGLGSTTGAESAKTG